MFIEEVEMYRTKDGEVFDCKKDAERHVMDRIGEELDGILRADEAASYHLGVVGMQRVLLALMGTPEKCEQLKAIINRYI